MILFHELNFKNGCVFSLNTTILLSPRRLTLSLFESVGAYMFV